MKVKMMPVRVSRFNAKINRLVPQDIELQILSLRFMCTFLL